MARIYHSVALIFVCFQATSALLIGNYLHSRLNDTILQQETQLHVYARIFSRYDIAAVANIGNVSDLQTVAQMLEPCSYNFYVSTRMIKPTLPAEYYAVFYKKDVVTVSDITRDQPTGALCMKVRVDSTGQEFIITLFHLSGPNIIDELEGLPDLDRRLVDYYEIESVLFIGDFNTFDFYMSEAEYNGLTVTTNTSYHWFLDYSDINILEILPGIAGAPARFLARGEIYDWVEHSSTKVFDIIEFFNLTLEEALGLATFIPIEMELREPILRT